MVVHDETVTFTVGAVVPVTPKEKKKKKTHGVFLAMLSWNRWER